MNVTQAMSARRSIRAYTPQAVDRKLLTEIFDAAARTPSWANTQPWEVFVADGEVMARIRAAYLDSHQNKAPSVTDIPRASSWSEAAKRRTQQLRPDMVRDCGDAADQFVALNNGIFGAPAAIFLCVDRQLSGWALFDLGAYCQSVMLLAAERGLATIPAITAVAYPQILRRELGIPENLNIVIGIAVGYEDTDNAINRFKSARDAAADTVRFCK